tara:strand:+ start:58 stop:543 length:486 start_codon:yes stop_codon:yes gene_type:complete
MLILAWARTYGVKYVIVRPTNNYGEGQYPEKLIPLCVKLLQRGKKIMLHDEGEPIRNWLHAEDTAEAVTTIVESGKVDEIFNIPGDFEQKNYLTVKKIIEAYYNNNVKWKDYVDLNHKRPGQDVRYALNGDKLKQLGWKPAKVFDEEIVKLVQFYKENFKW